MIPHRRQKNFLAFVICGIIALWIYYGTSSFPGIEHSPVRNWDENGNHTFDLKHRNVGRVKNNTEHVKVVLYGRCDNCYKWRFPWIITPRKSTCVDLLNGNASDIDLMLFITSKHINLANRQLLREVFNAKQWPNHKVRLVFLFGLDPSHSKKAEGSLRRESDTHGDILQSQVHGTYYNMTRMVYNGFQWAIDSCPNTKFIGKVSDDTILNVPGVLQLLEEKGDTELQDVIFGDCNTYGLPPFRQKGHRWYMSYKTYPFNLYPPFCSGGGFFMSLQTAKDMLSEAENIAYPNPHDDVNIGINTQLSGHCACPVPGFYMFGSANRLFEPAPMFEYNPHMNCANYHVLVPFLGIHLHRLDVNRMRRTWGYRVCYEGKTPSFKDLKCRRRYTCIDNDKYPSGLKEPRIMKPSEQ